MELDNEVLDQENLDQEVLDQENLDQEVLDQEVFDQEVLDQEDILSSLGRDVLILQSSGVEIDYTDLLSSIDSHLEFLEDHYIDYSQQLNDIQVNSFRLYYFIGGLYVAFAIVLGIKFLRIFL